MSEPEGKPDDGTGRRAEAEQDEMQGAVQKRAEREARGKEEREPTIWENLSLIGALGWLVVVPPLLGLLVGRWLDRLTGHTVLWSGWFIAGGVVLGAWLAWQRTNRP